MTPPPPSPSSQASDAGGASLSVLKRRTCGPLAEGEAMDTLYKLWVGAKSFHLADHYDDRGSLLPKRFPPHAGLKAPAARVQTPWVPAEPCCSRPREMCAPDASLWRASPWPELHFQLAEEHAVQVRYASEGTGAGARCTIEVAFGCGKYACHYRVEGSIDAAGEAGFSKPIPVP